MRGPTGPQGLGTRTAEALPPDGSSVCGAQWEQHLWGTRNITSRRTPLKSWLPCLPRFTDEETEVEWSPKAESGPSSYPASLNVPDSLPPQSLTRRLRIASDPQGKAIGRLTASGKAPGCPHVPLMLPTDVTEGGNPHHRTGRTKSIHVEPGAGSAVGIAITSKERIFMVGNVPVFQGAHFARFYLFT